MGTALIITFRESLEMLLILVPLIIYLKKVNQTSLSKYVYFGVLTGLASSVILGSLIYTLLNSFDVALQELFVGFLALILSGLILYNIIVINKQKKLTDPDSYKNAIKPSTLFLLAFITVFRECLEIILFTLPTLVGSLGSTLIGGVIGIVITICFGFILYKTSLKINVSIIFIIITGVLIYFGSLLFGEALVTFLPQYGDSIEKIGMLIYGVPTALIYIKKTLKNFYKKLM